MPGGACASLALAAAEKNQGEVEKLVLEAGLAQKSANKAQRRQEVGVEWPRDHLPAPACFVNIWGRACDGEVAVDHFLSNLANSWRSQLGRFVVIDCAPQSKYFLASAGSSTVQMFTSSPALLTFAHPFLSSGSTA